MMRKIGFGLAGCGDCHERFDGASAFRGGFGGGGFGRADFGGGGFARPACGFGRGAFAGSGRFAGGASWPGALGFHGKSICWPQICIQSI